MDVVQTQGVYVLGLNEKELVRLALCLYISEGGGILLHKFPKDIQEKAEHIYDVFVYAGTILEYVPVEEFDMAYEACESDGWPGLQ